MKLCRTTASHFHACPLVCRFKHITWFTTQLRNYICGKWMRIKRGGKEVPAFVYFFANEEAAPAVFALVREMQIYAV